MPDIDRIQIRTLAKALTVRPCLAKEPFSGRKIHLLSSVAETTEGRVRFHDWLGDPWIVRFSHPKLRRSHDCQARMTRFNIWAGNRAW